MMTKRPLSVTVTSWFFIAAGIMGLVYHAREFNAQGLFESEVVLGVAIRFLAILGGIFSLRGNNWARWLLLSWIAYHVVLSVFHTAGEVMVHAVIMAGTTYGLFSAVGSAYFRKARQEAPPEQT